MPGPPHRDLSIDTGGEPGLRSAPRQPTHVRATAMTRLQETLRTFAGLLAAEQPVNAGEADAAIWAYLASFEGLDAQAEALGVLERAVAGLDAGSAFMPILLDTLERHRARLSEPSA